jgi:hypothetical protein
MLRRHPIRGLLGGLLLGVGLALMLVMLGIAPLGNLTVVVIVVLFTMAGIGLAWVLPARPVR